LSIVVAAWLKADGLAACLDALHRQAGETCEVIVAAGFPRPDSIPRVLNQTWLDAGADLLIPQLWSRGISVARGDVVALTTSRFLPARGWTTAIRDSHARLDSFGVGGPVDPPRGGRAVDWATFFLRYSNYLHLDTERAVHEIAGDNASYKRSAIDAHRDVISDGFWEPDFHRVAMAAGGTLTFTPDMRVTQQGSFPVAVFVGQRLHHGRQFGFSRVDGKGVTVRLLRAASGVLVPLVLMAKVVGRVARSRRDYGPFLWAFPLLWLFVLAWSTGEMWGYLSRSGVEEIPGLKDVDT
jgi:hypothetical protein